MDIDRSEPQWREKPPVLPAQVPLLEGLLDRLLRLLALRGLLESVVCYDALHRLEFEGVAGRHEVVVVDDLDEGLDFRTLGRPLFRHGLGNLARVALDAGDEGVSEVVRLGPVVLDLHDDDLLAGITSPGDDCDAANFEKLHPFFGAM